MIIESLISTMNLSSKEEHDKLLKSMNITTKSIVINQCPNYEGNLLNIIDDNNRIISNTEKGLSKSRNKALKNSIGDICIIADDDLTYVNNVGKIIEETYAKYNDADIIAFYVENARPKDNLQEGKVNFLHSLKLCSVQITFKKRSIIDNAIEFDEKFGAGSDCFIMGEENIFLTDCLKKKLNIYYCPIKIATLNLSESSWFKGHNEKYFESRGAIYYRMSKFLSTFLILQFAIRKYKLYSSEVSFFNSIKFMFRGIRKYKSEKGKI